MDWLGFPSLCLRQALTVTSTRVEASPAENRDQYECECVITRFRLLLKKQYTSDRLQLLSITFNFIKVNKCFQNVEGIESLIELAAPCSFT